MERERERGIAEAVGRMKVGSLGTYKGMRVGGVTGSCPKRTLGYGKRCKKNDEVGLPAARCVYRIGVV